MRFYNAKKSRAFFIPALAACSMVANAGVKNVVLEDFEGTQSATPVLLTTLNSYASSNAQVTVTKESESGSNRLKLTKQSGNTAGFLLEFSNLNLEEGSYLITADVKVADSTAAPIASFGMGAVAGSPTASKINDVNGGYLMNLDAAGNNAGLGYQTLGATIKIPANTTSGKITLYFSPNPTGNDHVRPRDTLKAPATDGAHAHRHRGTSLTWSGSGSQNNAVYIDNIKLIGPGNAGENRHYWPSAGNATGNLARQSAYIDIAKDNGFNVFDFLARFRTDAYYIPNRDFTTYPNPEPFGTNAYTTSRKNDPLQFYIDRNREEGIKTYISYSCFAVSGNGTWPSVLPANAMNYNYNGGTPTPSTASTLYGDAGVPALRQHLTRVMSDIVQNYDIDGVIFDRIRLESINDGYNPQSLAAYGYAPGVIPAPNDPTFIAHRQNAYAAFLRESYEAATDIKPWVVVGTVPVVFGYDFTSTYNNVFQKYALWNSVKTRNRSVSFGAHDVIQPQLYRGTQNNSSYRDYNGHYMDYMRFGDIGAFQFDFGMAPGSYVNLEPLFYHPTVPDQPMSVWNAENLHESREKGMNGNGIYSADTTRTDMHFIRQATAYGQTDLLSGKPKHADHLMKAGYDNTPPNPVKNLAGTSPQNLQVNLSWAAPDTAEDGDTATCYLVHRGTLPGVKKYYANQVTPATTISGTNISDTVPAAGTYYYSVIAVDKYNNWSTPQEIGPITVGGSNPASAPSAPSVLQEFVLGNRVYLKWQDNSTNERAFEIRRNAVLIGTVSENVYFFRCDDMASGSATFSVRAVNSTGGSSEISSSISITDTLAPPSNVVIANSANGARLTWQNSNATQSGFEILRSANANGPWTQIATVGPFITEFTDSSVTQNDSWYYSLRTFNGVAYSTRSNAVQFSAEPPIGTAPVLTGNFTSGKVQLSWSDTYTNETGWNIYRKEPQESAFTLVTTLARDSVSYHDTAPHRGTWEYKATPFNFNGTGLDSNVLSIVVNSTPDIILESRLENGSITPSPTYVETGQTLANTTAKSLATGLKAPGSRYTGTYVAGAYVEFRPTIVDAGQYNVYTTGPNDVNGLNAKSPGTEYFIYGKDASPHSGTFDNSCTNTDLADKWLLLKANVPLNSGTGNYIQIYNRNTSTASSGQRYNIDAVKFEYSQPLAGIDFNESILY